jgi:hypothetical protein
LRFVVLIFDESNVMTKSKEHEMGIEQEVSGVIGMASRAMKRIARASQMDAGVSRSVVVEMLEGREMMAVIIPPVLADLKVATLTGFTGVMGPGQLVTGSINFTNAGKAVSGVNTAQIVISGDKVFGNADDILFTEVEVPELGIGKSKALTFSGEISNAAKNGKYFVLARVDNKDVVLETNELNNGFTGAQFSVGRPVVSVTGPVAKLGETGGKGTFVITRTGGSTAVPLTVPFEIAGSAVRGVDYELKIGNTVLSEGLVTIPSKAGSVTVGIFALGDSAIEGEESAKLTLLPGGELPAYTLNALKSSASLVIADDEPTVKLTASSTKIGEATGSTTFTVTRSGGSNKAALTVDFGITGIAAQGPDFKLVSMDGKTVLTDTVTFAPNAGSVTFKAVGIDDALIEGDEIFTIKLEPVAGAPTYSIDKLKNEATVTINDNEPVVTLTASSTKIGEATGSTTFTVTRSGGSNKAALTVDFGISGIAAQGADFKLVSMDGKTVLTDTVTFAANAGSVTFKAVGIDDALIEGDESFTIKLEPVGGAPTYSIDKLKNEATVTINDNEPVVTLTSTTTKTSETKGSASFTVARTGGSNKSALTVFLMSSGSAEQGKDFSLVSNDGKTTLGDFVVIPAGAASVTLKALITDDALIEGSENLKLGLGAIPGAPAYTISATKHEATVVIADNEPTVSLVATKASASETTPAVNKGQFKFTRTGGNTAGSLTVNFTIAGSATLGTDYSLTGSPVSSKLSAAGANGSITFAAGVSSVTVDLTALNDTLLTEGTETTKLTIVGSGAFAINAGKDSALVNIADGKAAPPAAGSPVIVGLVGSRAKITQQDPLVPEGVPGFFTATAGGGRYTAESGRAGTLAYNFTTTTPATPANKIYVLVFRMMTGGPIEDVTMTLTFTGTRAGLLEGKTIQFLAPGTPGTQGTFKAQAIVSMPGVELNGTFKIV